MPRKTTCELACLGSLLVVLVVLLAHPVVFDVASADSISADGTVTSGSGGQAVFGVDLLANGNGENGENVATGFEVVSDIPGWTRWGSVTVVRYASNPGRWPAVSDPGPVVRDAAFLTGGPDDQGDSLHQVVNLSDFAGDIDAGVVRFDLGGYLGGLSSLDDSVLVRLHLLDGSNDLLELRELESVTPEDRGNQTGMLLRTASGLLPVGTRSATIAMIFVGTSGHGSWGLVDSIGLSLSSTQVADVEWPGGATGLQLAIAPAPARGETYIAFTLPADGRVRVEVLDVTGRRVALLADGVRPAGQYEIRWSPRDSGAEAGVYFVRLASSSGTRVRRLVTLAR